MELSGAPEKLVLPWANGDSTKTNPIPVPSQQGVKPGAASWTDGYPPLCATPVSSGGIPPSKADTNGGLFQMSAVDVWACAGGGFKYDADFSAAVGGYPQGALVLQASGESYWISTVDNNTTDPDTGGAGWEPLVSGFVDWAAPGTIGSTTPNTGAFTTLSASTKLTAPTVSSSDDSTNAATTAWCLLGFAISLGASGYIKFPAWMGGFVFQWLTGTTTLTANEAATITESWPTAFPNACLIAFPSVKIDSTVTNNAQGYAAYLQSVTTTGVTAYMDCGADNVGTVNHRMIAWGIGN